MGCTGMGGGADASGAVVGSGVVEVDDEAWEGGVVVVWWRTSLHGATAPTTGLAVHERRSMDIAGRLSIVSGQVEVRAG